MSTRRSFIRNAALTTIGISAGLSNISKAQNRKDLKVIVLGAGIAGLGAAYKLKQAGIEVLVLESRNRIGGRIYSHKINKNLVVELGAEWIGQSHIHIQKLCEQFNLELINNQFKTNLIYQGKYSTAADWKYSNKWSNTFQHLVDQYPNLSAAELANLDKTDWWRYLINHGCTEDDLIIRELLDSTDFGEGIRHVSALSAMSEYAESSDNNEMDYKIKGGNSLLINKLADAIGRENILLQHSVTAINQNAQVHITCSNGKTFIADKLICTAPTFAINKINWTPALPLPQKEALQALQYARINKHVMVFDNKFWNEEAFDIITDELPHYFYHGTKFQHHTQGALVSYSIGEKAAVIAQQSHARNAEAMINTLKPHFGNIQHFMRQQANYYWGNDPISQGAYAMYGVGQWTHLRPILATSHLHTHFAGEHLADWQGFMEGALETGYDAADAVLKS